MSSSDDRLEVRGNEPTVDAGIDADAPTGAAPAPGEDLQGRRLGHYRIAETLGAGGMGAVYRAYDERLERDVALKILAPGRPESSRFLSEARAQARVDHPHVCKVYEVGVEDGLPWIAMQLVEGQPLHEVSSTLSRDACMRIMRDTAAAMHEAHRLGIIHRDLKPANVLVELRDDHEPHAYVVDFGLARDTDASVTSEVIAGTPQFMAPEQASGVAQLDRRTDVYGLGATLYRILTGAPPFGDARGGTLVLRLMNEEPTRPRKLDANIPVELELITLRCLEKEPERRYASARDLAEDLQRYLDGEPIHARPPSATYRLAKWARRHRALVALGAVSLVIAVVLSTMWWRERDAARQRRAEATRQVAAAEMLGREAAELDEIMRRAYLLPLHDITADKHLVRDRMKGIRARMAELGRAGEGPGHYALGRAHAALREYQAARDALVRARAAGFDSDDLALALGVALGELYRTQLANARRIKDTTARATRLRHIEKHYRDAANAELDRVERRTLARIAPHLTGPAPAISADQLSKAEIDRIDAQLSKSSEFQGSMYVWALMAFYAGRYDDAIGHAETAIELQPWHHRNHLLKARAHLARAVQHVRGLRRDAAQTDYAQAGMALAKAREIGRSDPLSHELECLRLTALVHYRLQPETEHDGLISRAVAACTDARTADPTSISAQIATATTHHNLASLRVARGGSPGDNFERAIAAARIATRAQPHNVRAWTVLGNARGAYAKYLYKIGKDPTPALRDWIGAFDKLIAIAPRDAGAHNNLGIAHWQLALHQIRLDADPAQAFRKALAAYRKATSLDPKMAGAFNNLGTALWDLARHQIRRNLDPLPSLAEARKAYAAALAIEPNSAQATLSLADCYRVQAEYLLDRGRDADDAIARAIVHYEAGHRGGQGYSWSWTGLAAVHLASARVHVGSGKLADQELRAAVAAIERALALDPKDADAYVMRARLHDWQARVARDLATRKHHTAAGREALRKALTVNPKVEVPTDLRARLTTP